ncbi:MAG: hypothetical protein LBI63_01475 [Candidatus Ancillula sp.]|jgi:hypothetical protein|nr:hypothetical protein [Candidatus Ancillula sp.]
MNETQELAEDLDSLSAKITALGKRRRKMIQVIVAVNIFLLVLVLVQFVITEVDSIKEYNSAHDSLKSHSQQMHDLSLDASSMLDKVGGDGVDYDEYKSLAENIKQSDDIYTKAKNILNRNRFSAGIITELQKYDEQSNNCLQRMHNNLTALSKRSDLLEYNDLRNKLDEMVINSTRTYNNSKGVVKEDLRNKLLDANKEASDLLNSNLSNDDIINSKTSLMEQLNSSISKIKELADEIQDEQEKAKKNAQTQSSSTPSTSPSSTSTTKSSYSVVEQPKNSKSKSRL